MANEELGKLSPEQIQKLAGTISEAKSLTSQQEEIIKRVLAGEIEIGNTRISSLEKYFDIYSKNLDLVARKHRALNDTFLILDKKLNDNAKVFSSNISKLEQQIAGLAKSTSEQSGNGSDNQATNGQKNSNSDEQKELISTIRELIKSQSEGKSDQQQRVLLANILNAIKERSSTAGSATQGSAQQPQNANISQTNFQGLSEDIINRFSRFIEGNSGNNGEQGSVEKHSAEMANMSASSVANYTEDSAREQLQTERPISIFEELEAYSKIRKAKAELVEAEKSGDEERINNAKQAYAEQEALLQSHQKEIIDVNKEHLNRLLNQEKTVYAQSLKLEDARNQSAEKHAMRLAEVRLSSLEEVQAAELKAQEFANSLNAERAFAQTEEAAAYQVRQANAEAEAKAIEELQKQKKEYLALLNAQSMVAEGGELTAEAAADNIKAAEERFSPEQRLADIKKRNATDAANKAFAAENPQLAEINEAKKAKRIAALELAERRKVHRALNAEELQAIRDQAEEEYELSVENLEKLEKERLRAEKKKEKDDKKASRKEITSAVTGPINKDHTLAERFKELSEHSKTKADAAGGGLGAGIVAAVDTAVSALSDILAELEEDIDKIAAQKGFIDTRLQGSKDNAQFKGSYWGQLNKDMMSVGAVTPFFRQEKFAENIKSLVDQGIAFDLKQRAFLMTIQEKIANTFNVADGTLLRLIRIQQEDSTAGRLGMESALNAFLNEMYETSEYLSTVATGVRNSLEEMEALMSGAEAAEVEYQVQKWMGSLYSVGMSQEAVNSIATALGQIAAGQVDALTNGGGAGNLIVMAANQAGKNISDILIKGLTASETNELLQATVNYLADLAESSKDSRVVQQQLANVFGVKASDLIAATNLKSGPSGQNSISAVYGESMSYANMLKQLNDMAGSMYLRTSLGEMMTNVWDNGQYSIASSMASNPAAYLIYKLASLLDAAVGGIGIPSVMAVGTGVDLETTVADLMRVGAVSGGILGSLGDMIQGLSSSFSGQAMLTKMGIDSGSGLKITPRGTGDGVGATLSGGGQQSVSSSGYIGNASGTDIRDTTLQEAEDTKDQLMIEALEDDIEHEQAHKLESINTNVIKIFALLDEVTTGKRNLNVKVTGYGLTSLGTNTSLNGAQAGIEGLLNNNQNNHNNGGLNAGNNAGSGSTTNGSSIGYGVGTGVDLGGWTII